MSHNTIASSSYTLSLTFRTGCLLMAVLNFNLISFLPWEDKTIILIWESNRTHMVIRSQVSETGSLSRKRRSSSSGTRISFLHLSMYLSMYLSMHLLKQGNLLKSCLSRDEHLEVHWRNTEVISPDTSYFSCLFCWNPHRVNTMIFRHRSQRTTYPINCSHWGNNSTSGEITCMTTSLN